MAHLLHAPATKLPGDPRREPDVYPTLKRLVVPVVAMSGTDDTERVSVDVDVRDGRTTIEVTGTREAATVVRSSSGERVYLPPEIEEPTDEADETPYTPGGGAEDSSYAGVPDSTPYSSGRGSPASVGQMPMPNGFRILHPEPVTDVRIVRSQPSTES
jgi:hypothetical protein